jgi:hypothetical protein
MGGEPPKGRPAEPVFRPERKDRFIKCNVLFMRIPPLLIVMGLRNCKPLVQWSL